MKVMENCFRCGKEIYRSPSIRKRSKRAFCSRQCNLQTMNAEMNPSRMTANAKTKIRNAHLGKGKSLGYAKFHGRHLHRIVAEEMLGKALVNEVIHHKDGNKRNNVPANLEIMPSQAEHARLHFTKVVMPYESISVSK